MIPRTETPPSAEAAAEVLRACAAEGWRLRPRGGGTKLSWGMPAPEPDLDVSTAALDRILEHNVGDLTAVLQAGAPLVEAQRAFAAAGQMLALDPPLAAPRARAAGQPVSAAGEPESAAAGEQRPAAGEQGPCAAREPASLARQAASPAARQAASPAARQAASPRAEEPTPRAATIGGIVATGDSGPLCHRYGAPRDLVLGMTVALADGSLARSGGKVIKNVAGYDLAKLFAGSFGTLGLIVEVVVRLHPRSERQVTAMGASRDPERLQRAASALAHAPLEMEALDVIWSRGRGSVLACFGGTVPMAQARRAERILGETGLEPSVTEDNQALWERQRAWQRSAGGAVLRVSGLPSRLADVLRAAERLGASVVGRAGLGLCWIRLEGPVENRAGGDTQNHDHRPPQAGHGDLVAAIAGLRRELDSMPCVLLDAPAAVRERAGAWPAEEGPALDLMRRVKERFDPRRTCNPGIFVGGI